MWQWEEGRVKSSILTATVATVRKRTYPTLDESEKFVFFRLKLYLWELSH
jgi:hypothetical protein